MYSNPTPYPSVTEILSPYVSFSRVPPAVLQAACERGTLVHEAVAALLRDEFPVIPDGISGYVASFERWRDAVAFGVHLVEERLSDISLRYTGQIDAVVRFEGDDCLTVIDWKTATVGSPAWAIQTAAYCYLINCRYWDGLDGFPVRRRMSIRLKKNGKKPIITEYNQYATDMAVFHGLLNAYHYFKPKTIQWEEL